MMCNVNITKHCSPCPLPQLAPDGILCWDQVWWCMMLAPTFQLCLPLWASSMDLPLWCYWVIYNQCKDGVTHLSKQLLQCLRPMSAWINNVLLEIWVYHSLLTPNPLALCMGVCERVELSLWWDVALVLPWMSVNTFMWWPRHCSDVPVRPWDVLSNAQDWSWEVHGLVPHHCLLWLPAVWLLPEDAISSSTY